MRQERAGVPFLRKVCPKDAATVVTTSTGGNLLLGTEHEPKCHLCVSQLCHPGWSLKLYEPQFPHL